MDALSRDNYTPLNTSFPIWDQVFTVAPLVVIGTKEGENYDLAPKHMATPVSFNNYFGFTCTPEHSTYQNIKKTFILFFILENLQEFIKALKNLMNVLNQILLVQMLFLNFV